jgi:hypothetical protein
VSEGQVLGEDDTVVEVELQEGQLPGDDGVEGSTNGSDASVADPDPAGDQQRLPARHP